MPFRSVAEAERALEGPDVLAGTYEAFDSNGQPLEMTSDGGPNDYSARVRIQPSFEAAVPGKLEGRLRSGLEAMRAPAPENSTLADLIASLLRTRGFEP